MLARRNLGIGLAAGVAPTLRRCLPLLALLTALATLFPFFLEAGPLHRAEQVYDRISFHHLAAAKNLAAEHGWLGFRFRTLDDHGEAYVVYHRFPPLGYFLIKLAILTQPGDLASQIQAARMLMLALYAGAALLAFASLALITGRQWLAAAATLAAFGSYAGLRASDMVATEGAVDLFGMMLAFHGVARYCFPGAPGVPASAGERRRFGQLLAKACVALLLGWHVYALLVPFVGLGAAAALVGRNWAEFHRLALFAALALLFGVAVLAQNLAREHAGLGGAVPLWDLPSFASARRRSVFGGMGGGLGLAFAADQLWRTGVALAPYAVSRIDLFWPGWPLAGGLALAAIGGGALATLRGCDCGGRRAAGRQLWAACLALAPLAAAGHVWAVGMRGNLFSYRCQRSPDTGAAGWDVFEAMFHVGAPLALFSLLGLLLAGGVSRTVALAPRPGAVALRLAAAACVAALWLAFVASAFHMGRLDRDPETAARERELHDDVAAIRQALPKGSAVYVPRGSARTPLVWRRHFYFTDHIQIRRISSAGAAEFVAAPRIPGASALTPGNRRYFLYGMEEYRRHRGPPRRGEGGFDYSSRPGLNNPDLCRAWVR